MIRPSKSQYFGAGAMALVVHTLFALGLVISVDWRSVPELPAYAELWRELPALPPAADPVAPAAPPETVPPQALVGPEPEISLQVLEVGRRQQEADQLGQERRRLQVAEQGLHQPEQHRLKPQPTAEAARREPEDERRREELRRLEEQHQLELAQKQEAQEQRRRDEARRELEAELARQLQEDLAREMRQLQRRAMSQAELAARLQMIEEYRSRIRNKILSYLILPPNLSGNPEVVYQVRLLPDGEVLNVTLIKSSGQPTYDKHVERAILRASPLPLPPDRELAAAFREELILKFRPYETDGGRS